MPGDYPSPAGEAESEMPRRRPTRGSLLANAVLLLVSLAGGLMLLEFALGLTHYRDLTRPRTEYTP